MNDPPLAFAGSETMFEDSTLSSNVPPASDPDGDAVTYSLVSGLAGLTFHTDGSFTYEPAADFNGIVSFTYKANDGTADSDPATVTIRVRPVNDAPTLSATPPSLTIDEDSGAHDVVVAGSDKETATPDLSFSVSQAPAHGTLTGTLPGTLSYTPAPNFNGSDSFTVKVLDRGDPDNCGVPGLGCDAPAFTERTVDVTVNAVNDAPVAQDDAATTAEDTPVDVDVLANDTDVDGDTLSIASFTQPAHGTVSLVAGKLRYAPAADYNGPDSFTYKANDGQADSNAATVSITVTAVNDAPVAHDSSHSTDEDTTLNAAVSATDVDGDTLTYSEVGPHLAGLTLNADGTFTYVPPADFHGTKTFQFKANDGHVDSNVATVTITVNSVNDAPVAVNDSKITQRDTFIDVDVLANDTDVDGDTLTVASFTQPANGTVTLVAGKLRYTPAAGYTGPDSFTYKATDGLLESNVATVSITVNAVNHAPVAADSSHSTDEDTTLNASVSATDEDGDTLTYSEVGPHLPGLTLNADGTFTYVPPADFHGTKTFQFTANDGHVDSNVATVTITVNSVNDAPVALDASRSTDEDTTLNSAVLATDADGDTLTFSEVGPHLPGLTLNADGTFTYVPPADFHGTKTFQFKANDGHVDSNVATVTITVNSVNDAPVAHDATRTTPEDTTLSSSVPAATDVDGDTLTYALVAGLPGLTFNADGTFTYTPPANFNGTKTFTYEANDGTVDSNVATITIEVTPVNDAPVAHDATRTTPEDTTLSSSVPAATDVDGDPLTYAQVGSLEGLTFNADGTFTYTPPADFHGTKTFTYKANDGTVDSNVATITIEVTPVNDRPVSVNDAYATDEDTTLSVTAPGVLGNDSDVDGDTLTAVLQAGPAHGTLTLNADGSLNYVPNSNFNGTDSFQYRASDGALVSTPPSVVTITVNAVNDAPVAVDDSANTPEDTAVDVDVLANDTDVDGDTLSIASFTQPAHGTVTQVAGKLRYTPAAGYTGPDSFTYKANDGTVDSNAATVSITVTEVNHAPVATDDAASTPEDTAVDVDVLANDTDADGDNLSIASFTQPAHGSVGNVGGKLRYTPTPNYNGPDSFTYKATDGLLQSNTATVSITVTAVNDAPVAASDSYVVSQDATLTIPAPGVLANDTDVEGQALSAVSPTAASNGTATLNANGSFTYTPNAGFTGSDSFTYRASDGSANSNVATVAITVTPTSPPPDAPCTITGTPGNDTLNGTAGNDVICGLGGNDRMDGRAGNDVIRGGAGADTGDGGDGNDTILGEAGNDTVLDGQAGKDVVLGGAGHDKMVGGLGNDSLQGEAGRDWLIPGEGNDILDGGPDQDEADFKDSPAAVQVDLTAGTASGEGSDTLAGIEQVMGSANGDVLLGSAGDDELKGYRGNDQIDGRAGNDFIDGGPNTDICDQGPGTGTVVNCEGHQTAGAGSVATASSTFTQPNQVATGTVGVTAGSPSFSAVFTWDGPAAAFTVVGEVVKGGQVVARGLYAVGAKKPKKKVKVVKLRLKKQAGAGYMIVSGSVPKQYRVRGVKLRFKLKATTLTERTTVSTTVTQKRR